MEALFHLKIVFAEIATIALYTRATPPTFTWNKAAKLTFFFSWVHFIVFFKAKWKVVGEVAFKQKEKQTIYNIPLLQQIYITKQKS